MKKIFLALVITFAAVTAAAADTVYLRGGTSLRGTLLGFVNGRFAFQLSQSATLPIRSANTASAQTTRTARIGEVVFLRPRDVERLEVDGRSLDEARYQTQNIDVALGPNWVDTGVEVRRGERIRIDATGTIYAGRTRITPAGLSTTDPSAPLPRAAEGQLIGVIGNDFDAPIIELGVGREFTAERDGRLYLTINRGSYTDARGAFNVRIRKEIDLTAMGRTGIDDRTDDSDPFGFPGESTGPAPTRSRRRGDFPTNDRRPGRMLERTFNVAATESRGVDTGIDLRAGDQITISASGSITAGQRVGAVGPDGARSGASAIFGVSRRPVPNAGVGALIGSLALSGGGTSQPFLVGSQLTFTAPSDGRLYLLVNDDNYGDNSGSFVVRILYPDYR
ncbi:MAG TPA: LecA/PA-IL family lectin [Pyrinomonadaceae bacterium]